MSKNLSMCALLLIIKSMLHHFCECNERKKMNTMLGARRTVLFGVVDSKHSINEFIENIEFLHHQI